MSRSEIYTKFHFSVLNNSCLIHITIENCVKSREKMIYSSFYQEKLINYVFVNFMVSVSFTYQLLSGLYCHGNLFLLLKGMRIADTRLLYDSGPTRKIWTKTIKKNNYFIASNEHTFTNSSVPPKTTILWSFEIYFMKKEGDDW